MLYFFSLVAFLFVSLYFACLSLALSQNVFSIIRYSFGFFELGTVHKILIRVINHSTTPLILLVI